MLKRELGIETKLIEGDRGEFSVLVGDEVVIKKGWFLFPQQKKVLAAVQQAMSA
jgi:hypothetical protein